MCIGRLNKQIRHELPPTNLIFISKKLIVSFEYSAVNFIVGWKLFNLLRNFSRDSSPCSQIKKMSSMYLQHIIGFFSGALRIFSSKSTINKMAYGGANFVPIAVPRTCLKVFSSNWKTLFFSTISASSIRVSRGGSRTAATYKMGFQPLTIITKRSILDDAAVLDPPLVSLEICLLSLNSKILRREVRPSLCGILR